MTTVRAPGPRPVLARGEHPVPRGVHPAALPRSPTARRPAAGLPGRRVGESGRGGGAPGARRHGVGRVDGTRPGGAARPGGPHPVARRRRVRLRRRPAADPVVAALAARHPVCGRSASSRPTRRPAGRCSPSGRAGLRQRASRSASRSAGRGTVRWTASALGLPVARPAGRGGRRAAGARGQAAPSPRARRGGPWTGGSTRGGCAPSRRRRRGSDAGAARDGAVLRGARRGAWRGGAGRLSAQRGPAARCHGRRSTGWPTRPSTTWPCWQSAGRPTAAGCRC